MLTLTKSELLLIKEAAEQHAVNNLTCRNFGQTKMNTNSAEMDPYDIFNNTPVYIFHI